MSISRFPHTEVHIFCSSLRQISVYKDDIMARLVKYSARDENRYSTFLDPATQSNNSTNNDNFESFNQFKLCDTHKIIKKQRTQRKRQKFNFASQRINYILKNCCSCCCRCWCAKSKDKHNNNETYKYDINQKIMSLKKLQVQYDDDSGCNNNSDNDDEEDDIYNVPSIIVRRDKIANGRYNASGTLQSEMQAPGKQQSGVAQKWTWNESLRSNSDKFLETLEYDDLLIIDRSLKRMKKAAKVRPIAYRTMGGTAGNSFLFD